MPPALALLTILATLLMAQAAVVAAQRSGLAPPPSPPPPSGAALTHPPPPHGPPPSQLPPVVPAWVAPRNFSTDYRTTSLDYNVRLVRNANQTKALFDFAMWGDSLTANLLFDLQSAPVWDRYFSKAQAGWTSARLGVGGSTVEELTWRLMEGGEKFAIDPLIALVLIGINNELDSQPWDKLDYLLGWMGAAMPLTKIVVLAPLPSVLGRSATLLKGYRPVVKRHGLELSLCGQDLNPGNSALFMDGLHLRAPGYEILLSCLKPRLATLRDASLATRLRRKSAAA